MSHIIKKFENFSILENVQGEKEVTNELEESPLLLLSEELELPIEKDEKGEFIQTEEGKIRFFSETGYYNETTKAKYGEDVAAVLAALQEPVLESRRCRDNACRRNCRCQK